MARRIANQYITTAANNNEQFFTFTTGDENRQRNLKLVFVGAATAGVQIALYNRNQKVSSTDLTRFAAGNGPIDIDVTYDQTVPIVVTVTNLAGAAITNLPVMLEYDVQTT